MKRVEDPRLIRGIATYVDDLRLPGMLHAAFVRSPYAHARIARISDRCRPLGCPASSVCSPART